jgi:hypothetical protein
MRNHAWELAVHQAREIVRGFGEPQSQESEVMAAASVGQLGLVLARTVLAAVGLDKLAEELRTSPGVVLIQMPEWLRLISEGQQLLGCQTCGSRDPARHPAAGEGGEVTGLCPDSFHGEPPADTSWLTSFRPSAEVQAMLDQQEWERGGALKRLAEELLGPEVPDA